MKWFTTKNSEENKLEEDKKVAEVIGAMDKERFCIVCKYCIDPKEGKYAKCSHPSAEIVVEHSDYYYVTGVETTPQTGNYHHCSTSRGIKSMCGKEGKFFERRV